MCLKERRAWKSIRRLNSKQILKFIVFDFHDIENDNDYNLFAQDPKVAEDGNTYYKYEEKVNDVKLEELNKEYLRIKNYIKNNYVPADEGEKIWQKELNQKELNILDACNSSIKINQKYKKTE